MTKPTVPEALVDVVSDEDFKKLLRQCEGPGFEQRCDTAILRLLRDTGIRRGELLGLRVDDVDLQRDLIAVVGKGSLPRIVPFSNEAGRALSRYIKERAKHPFSAKAAFWLGRKGALTETGLGQMIWRRCERAGLPKLHPHQFPPHDRPPLARGRWW